MLVSLTRYYFVIMNELGATRAYRCIQLLDIDHTRDLSIHPLITGEPQDKIHPNLCKTF